MVDTAELFVAEALKTDVGRGIIRLDSETMERLGVTTGDVVEIKGKKSTVAIVWPAHPHDEGHKLIRMDGQVRQNAGVGMGDKVVVKKIDAKPAKKVVFSPYQPMRFSPGFDELLKRRLEGRPVMKGDTLFISIIGSTSFPLIVALTQPIGAVIINEKTVLEIKEEPLKDTGKIPTVSYEDIGGLKEEIRKIREMVELPLRHPELFERLGIEAPKGVLIHGSPGTGKTLLAKAVANESDANFIYVGGPELISKFVGESEERLRQLFREAEENAPSIVFMDEIDAIAPKREEATGEVERRMVSQLLALMDGLKARGQVIVIGATNRPNAIDPALRRPGRFDREIEIGIPDREARREILTIHTRNMPLDKDVDLDYLANATHGYTGADISLLCKEAAMKALRRIMPKINLEEETIPIEILESITVKMKDFQDAMREIQPSALREVFVEIPNVRWSDIGGLDDVKKKLKEAVELPLKNPEVFQKMGIRTPKGILLYGAPGTGKTLLAKAVATESEANFISIKGPEVLCVSEDTPILTTHCGLRAISELYENLKEKSTTEYRDEKKEVRKLTEPVYVLGMNLNGKIENTRIIRMHKLYVKNAYRVYLANTNIVVSENQPFLVFKDKNIRWIKIRDIQEGDYVAVPARLNTLNQSVELKIEFPKEYLVVKEDEENWYVKMSSDTVSRYTRLPKKITPELCEFLGWFCAEGNITKDEISISNKAEKNRKRIKELFSLFVDEKRIKEYEERISIYSTPLIFYLEKIFERDIKGKKSYKIVVPPKIFKTEKKLITAFLKGAYNGDGHIDEKKIEYGTMSKEMAEGIKYLLTFLGIKARIWQRKDNMFMITISGKKEMNKFLNEIYEQNKEITIRRYYNARYMLPDISELLREVKLKLGLHYGSHLSEGLFEGVINKRKRCGVIRLRRMLKEIDQYATPEFKETEEYKTLSILANGEISWTKIERIEKEQPQVMYDIETENSTFIGGKLPLLLHNSKWVGESEKAIREMFRKARLSAPCVIFIDEIDAIAPMRGGMDEGTHVTERMVNTLLLEMDGVEQLKNIVVIAATNRPDILDPALLRPGRFDNIIEIPLPDEKTRLEILKVHTKRMPLDKDVDLELIASKLTNMTGADIEGLVREAGMNAIRARRDKVALKDFENALAEIRPTLKKEHTERIKKFEENMKGMYA
jgi:transitional endoplasmic reticulum ATPase